MERESFDLRVRYLMPQTAPLVRRGRGDDARMSEFRHSVFRSVTCALGRMDMYALHNGRFRPPANEEDDDMSKEQADGYFGLCPHCHNNDGYVNTRSAHWFVCDEHKVMWFIGSNLFSSWKDETEEEQERAFYARGLDEYSRIEPYYPPQENFCDHSEDSQKDATT